MCLVKFIFICRQGSVLRHGKKQEEKKTQRAGLSKSEAESWKETATCTECHRHFVQVEIDIHSNSTSERLGAYKSKKSNPKGIIELSCIGKSEKVKETETNWVFNYLNVVLHIALYCETKIFRIMCLLGDRMLIDISTDMSADTWSNLHQDVGGESV